MFLGGQPVATRDLSLCSSAMASLVYQTIIGPADATL